MTEEKGNVVDIRKSVKTHGVRHEIGRQPLKWCGHVMSMDDRDIVKQTTLRWLDNKEEKLGKIGSRPIRARYSGKLLGRLGVDK